MSNTSEKNKGLSMSFKDYMKQKIGHANYTLYFPSRYSEIEIVTFAQEWHDSELKKLIQDSYNELANTEVMKTVFNKLSDAERLDIFSFYCRGCGSNDPKCQCWNDD